MIRKFFALGLMVLFSGCATRNQQAIDVAQYLEGVQGESVRASRSGSRDCPGNSSSWENEAQWRRIIQMASACVKAGSWTQVEAIGNHLAQREHVAPWGSYYLSLAAEKQGALPRALWMIDLALKKAPREALLVYQQGRVFWAMGEPEKAMENFQMALRLNPELVDAHLTLGLIFYRDQEQTHALRHLEKVLSVEPRNVSALMALGEIHYQRKNMELAQQHLARAARERRSDENLQKRLAQINEELAVEQAQAVAAARSREPSSTDLEQKEQP